MTDLLQDEGEPDRDYLGIDGTMGDAQDVTHPFIASVYGEHCRVCGLARSYRRHVGDGSQHLPHKQRGVS